VTVEQVKPPAQKTKLGDIVITAKAKGVGDKRKSTETRPTATEDEESTPEPARKKPRVKVTQSSISAADIRRLQEEAIPRKKKGKKDRITLAKDPDEDPTLF